MGDEPLTPFQSRVKAGALIITTAAGLALLLHDWGPGTVFSGIRPAVKSILNRAYGIQPQRSQASKSDDRSL